MSRRHARRWQGWRVAIRVELRWIAGVLGATGLDDAAGEGATVAGVSIDTRQGTRDMLFVALPGSGADGHDYIPAAVQGGAAAVLVQAARRDEALRAARGVPVLAVAEPLAGLQALAGAWRERVAPRVVAVTGTSGKTGTRDLIAAVLARAYRVHATRGNLNNHIGVPLTILAMPEDTQVLVLEMGASGAGEIASLCRIAPPQVGVITNIGPGHLEFFGSLEAVARAKAELVESLEADGTAVLPADDEFIDLLKGRTRAAVVTFGFDSRADLAIEEVRPRTGGGYTCSIGGTSTDMRRSGRHLLLNAAAAVAVGRVLEVPAREAAAALAAVPAGEGRGVVFEIDGITFVDESYNSNPASLRAAVAAFMEMEITGRRWLVLGDMLELGSASAELHAETGVYCGRAGVDGLITLGPAAVEISRAAALQRKAPETISHFMEPLSLAAHLDTLLASGDGVLVKGSRGMHMETVIAEIEKRRAAERRRVD